MKVNVKGESGGKKKNNNNYTLYETKKLKRS